MMITKSVTFIAKGGDEVKMKELLSAMVNPSKAEVGCLFYEIFQYQNDKSRFMAVETWESEESLDEHKASSHYKIYKSSYEKYCDEKYSDELETLG